jgi:hypothetical protein
MTPWQEKRGKKEVTVYTERTIEEIIGPLDVTWLQDFPDVFYLGIYLSGVTVEIPVEELDKLIEIMEKIRRCAKTSAVASRR